AGPRGRSCPRTDSGSAGPIDALGSDRTEPTARGATALRVAPARASLPQLCQSGGTEPQIPGAGPPRPSAELPALRFRGLAMRRARPVYRLECGHAAGAPAAGDQQYAISPVALGSSAPLGQPRAQSGVAPLAPGLAAQIRPPPGPGRNFRRYLALHGRLLSGRQLARVGPDHRAHAPRPRPSAPGSPQAGVGLSTGAPVPPPLMRLSRRQQLFELARTALDNLVDLVLRLEAEVCDLRRQVKELKARLALNSRNSSKPPSSDGLAKPPPKSLRQKSGRRPGGQPGHPGRTLQPVAQPDHVRVHKLDLCPCGACHGRSLRHEPLLDYEKRQVFELPQKPLEVTEHQAEVKRCPVSGRVATAPFPEGVCAPAQYGPRFKAQMVYFNDQHFIPYQRLTQVCEDLYGQPLSEATVAAANQRTYDNLAPFQQRLEELLPQAPVNGCDESGLRVGESLHWLHVVSNPWM